MQIFSIQQLLKNKWAIWLICLLIAVIWLSNFVMFRMAPEWDNMEELVWANSFELGYQKHPPFPTWILYPLTLLFGKKTWLPSALGLLCIAVTQVVTYHLYLRIAKNAFIERAQEFALLAVLVTSAVIYYTIRGGDFNHNEAQLASIAAMYYLYYVSWEKERTISLNQVRFLLSWFLFGICFGLAFISKYSVVIQAVVLCAHFFWSGRWRWHENFQGVLLAGLGFFLITAPHLWWLYHQTMLGQGPLYYVSLSMTQHLGYWQNILQVLNGFLLTQILRILPCLLVLGVIFRMCRAKTTQSIPSVSSLNWWSKIGKPDQQYLLFLGLGPTIVTMLIGAAFNERVDAKWAVTFFIMIGFIGFVFANDTINMRLLLKRVLYGHLVVAMFYGVITGPVADRFGYRGRANFPSQALAHVMQERWNDHPELTGGKPIRLVVGDTWIIGNVIIHDDKDMGRGIIPWIEGSDLLSPWLKPTDKEQAALIMIDYSPKPIGWKFRAGHPPSTAVKEMFDRAPVKGVESIPWTRGGQPLEVQWAILPYASP